MANLAIQGHATRGKEVIELLEMFGGKQTADICVEENSFYAVEDGIYVLVYVGLVMNATPHSKYMYGRRKAEGPRRD